MEKTNSELRKGNWTQEEDNLLRACVHKYGEGKWHLVPHRAGLRRCRKSCRMRWLNYLKPNINRGSFSDDEVDMIRRLHKLLGNRWSLIAGRLPGRTANGVKNFWYTNMRNKRKEERQETKEFKEANSKNDDVEETGNVRQQHHVVIKPQPHSFSKNSPWLRRNNDNKNKVVSASDKGDAGAGTISGDIKEGSVAERDQSEEWWESCRTREWVKGNSGIPQWSFQTKIFLKWRVSLGKARVVGVTVRTSSS